MNWEAGIEYNRKINKCRLEYKMKKISLLIINRKINGRNKLKIK